MMMMIRQDIFWKKGFDIDDKVYGIMKIRYFYVEDLKNSDDKKYILFKIKKDDLLIILIMTVPFFLQLRLFQWNWKKDNNDTNDELFCQW